MTNEEGTPAPNAIPVVPQDAPIPTTPLQPAAIVVTEAPKPPMKLSTMLGVGAAVAVAAGGGYLANSPSDAPPAQPEVATQPIATPVAVVPAPVPKVDNTLTLQLLSTVDLAIKHLEAESKRAGLTPTEIDIYLIMKKTKAQVEAQIK